MGQRLVVNPIQVHGLMNSILGRFQQRCRTALRPAVRMARRALTPPAEPVRFGWHTIQQGPAAGCRVLLPQGAAISEAIVSGRYERAVLDVIEALLQPGDVCYDIGGHYGYYTLSLANLCPQGVVHTFEPVREHADRIREAATRSSLHHVTVHAEAVAGKVGSMDLQIAGEGNDDSMAYLEDYGGVDTPAAREHYPAFSRRTVATTTLDQISQQLPAPRFIKIDAEGAEAAIVEAGRTLLKQTRPRLLIELHGIHEALRCAETLQSVDYRAVLLTDQNTTLPVLWVHRDDEEAVEAVAKTKDGPTQILFDRS